MKLLIIQTVAFNPNQGGVQRITYNLGYFFTKQGHQVYYYSFDSENHIDVKFGTLHHPEITGVKKNISHLKKIIDNIRPNIIINQMPYDKNISKELKYYKIKGIKIYGCIHNSLFSFKSNVSYIVEKSFPKPLGTFFSKKPFSNIALLYHKYKHRKELLNILKRHSCLILYTPRNYDELIYFLPENRLKKFNIDFMPNPVLVSNLNKNIKKEKIILHVGRINNMQKRSDLLLDFWQCVHESLPDWKFQILGDGPYLKELKNDLINRNLSNIEILGFQKPEPFFEKASIFMMPSAYEGFPNTVIEAQIYGCPVIAFDSYAAISWIVQDEVNAYLIEPYHYEKMAKKCIELANNNTKLKSFQKSATENAEKFSLENIGRKWEKLFKKSCN